MWSIDAPWFDVAVMMSVFAAGNILFGHFEHHRPKWKRLLTMTMFVAVLYIHIVWLPKHGINGWTAEPYDKYLEPMRSRGHV